MKIEEYLGIVEEPTYTCPNINSVISSINKAYNIAYDCEKECNNFKNQCNHQDDFEDIRYQLFGLENILEQLRKDNENLRCWGQEWKDIAMKLLKENDKT